MNTKVLTTLEYNKIIDLLTEKADSEPGKKLCRDLVPSTDLSTIRTAQRETKDALARLFRIGSTWVFPSVLWKSAVLCPCPNC